MESVKKSKKWFIIGGIAIIVVIIGVIAGLYINKNYIVPEKQYKEAIQAMNDKDFSTAIEIFTKLGDYKDSSDQVLYTKYTQANYLASELKNYNAAINLLKTIEGYKDSSDLIMSLKYEQGVQLYEDGEWSTAKSRFQSLGDYGDSETYLNTIEQVEKLVGLWVCVDNPYRALTFADNGDFIYYINGQPHEQDYTVNEYGTISTLTSSFTLIDDVLYMQNDIEALSTQFIRPTI